METRVEHVNEAEVHPHVPAERADLFETIDSQTTEIEYLALLTALIRVFKPMRVLETGTHNGRGTLAMALACQANGLGMVDSVELDEKRVNKAEQLLKENSLENWADVHWGESLAWITKQTQPFDFVFLDSDLPRRCSELTALLDMQLIAPGGHVAIHDTSMLRTARDNKPDPRTITFWSEFQAVREQFKFKTVFEFPLSRGMLLIKP